MGEGPVGVSVGRGGARPSLAGAGVAARQFPGGPSPVRRAGRGRWVCAVRGSVMVHRGWQLSCTFDGIPLQNCPAGWNGAAQAARVSLGLSVLPSLETIGVHLPAFHYF